MRCGNRLDYMQLAAGSDADAGGDVVPTSKLIERDAESIGNGDKRIAATRGVKHRMRSAFHNRSEWHDDSLNACEDLPFTQLICFGKLALAYAITVGNGGERVIGDYVMVAPCVAMCLRNERDALLE